VTRIKSRLYDQAPAAAMTNLDPSALALTTQALLDLLPLQPTNDPASALRKRFFHS
jgi:hypothetical protein